MELKFAKLWNFQLPVLFTITTGSVVARKLVHDRLSGRGGQRRRERYGIIYVFGRIVPCYQEPTRTDFPSAAHGIGYRNKKRIPSAKKKPRRGRPYVSLSEFFYGREQSVIYILTPIGRTGIIVVPDACDDRMRFSYLRVDWSYDRAPRQDWTTTVDVNIVQ